VLCLVFVIWLMDQIKCAFVEIYNEEIKDLLHPDTPSKSISIREDANGDIILAGVKEEVVTSFENMIRSGDCFSLSLFLCGCGCSPLVPFYSNLVVENVILKKYHHS
jgi:hypothetical protein